MADNPEFRYARLLDMLKQVHASNTALALLVLELLRHVQELQTAQGLRWGTHNAPARLLDDPEVRARLSALCDALPEAAAHTVLASLKDL